MNLDDRIVSGLRKNPFTIKELAVKYGTTQKHIRKILLECKHKGLLLQKHGTRWAIGSTPEENLGPKYPYISRSDNTYCFGFIGDNHLCSRYERLDILNDLYDIFDIEGVDRVFHAGNWVDGECKLNRNDLLVHGLDDQCKYLVDNYPRKNFTTFAIAGDDHEGWWAKTNGIDIGAHVHTMMRNGGRADWCNLGYMESFVTMINANTRKESQLLVMHPGGGSAYALSYRPQKIVESFSGGEKPGVLLIGHYHKLSYNIIRNVHVVQVGCTQDQTVFMRKKGLEAHLGGGICRITQDPRDGTLFGCQIQFFTYCKKGFKNNRWNYAGQVVV